MPAEPGRREAQREDRDLRIITAIMLGKKRNKELAQLLDTDKSFAAKKVKELEEKGLIHKVGTGKDTRYEVNEFNVLRFLRAKVVITVGKKKKEEKK